MGRQTIEVGQTGRALGAEIGGVDLAGPLDDATIAAIRQALLDHLVIFFRDQTITPAQHLAFARRFGETADYPMLKGLEGFPEIVEVVKLEHEEANFGGAWHSDTAYLDVPPMGSILVAREVPDAGGDTEFANMYAAYESLSDGMKELIGALKAVNSSTNPVAAATRQHRIGEGAKRDPAAEMRATHPVVRTHPETGRKALYVNPAHTIAIEGMSEAESAPILGVLYAHQQRPEIACRFHWTPGAIAFWDNRAAQHNAINDYHGRKRLMHRVTLAGERPV
ncbi:MAG TPA: TauD/TfdA family dioxygenase [Alphaproteobacteria bacterium]|nr:TauD/TfdA family dioxygenase [Alphaproteobacteria bacterium]